MEKRRRHASVTALSTARLSPGIMAPGFCHAPPRSAAPRGPRITGVKGGAVSRQVHVRVPPSRAFAAFVDVNDVLNWLADGAVIGRRPGGRWGVGWYADPDSDAGYHSMGVFEAFEPGRRLVIGQLVFSTPEGEEFGPMRLVVEFEEFEGGTIVTITQEGIDESAAWDGYREGLGPGWERTLEDLRGWLEEGRKLPGR